MADGRYDRCPACGAIADVDGDAWCGACGLELRGEQADELREMAGRLVGIDAELQAIHSRREALAAALDARRFDAGRHHVDAPVWAPPEPAFAPASPEQGSSRHVRNESSVESVRNVLLWTGATLLALSALAFTAVAWTHLGPGGRAALLVAITVVSALLAVGLRRRLPATAGAFTGLTIALALIDWQVVHKAGVAPSLSTAAWWAIGTAGVGVLAAGLGRVAAPVPARRALALLLPGSAVLTVVANANAAWSAALGLAVVTAALVVVDRALSPRFDDPVVRAILRVSAAVLWIVGAAFAIVAAAAPTTFGQTLTPAAVMLAFSVAPAVARARPAMRTERAANDPALLAAAMLLAAIGAVLTLASTSVGPIGLLTLAALLGGAGVAVTATRADGWKRAAYGVGGLVAVPALVFTAFESIIAELGPLAWLGHAGTGATAAVAVEVVAGPRTSAPADMGWCAVAVLVGAAAVIAITARARRARSGRPAYTETRLAVALAVALLAVVLVPLAAGSSALAAGAVTTGATAIAIVSGAIATRRRPALALALPSCLVPLIPMVPAVGWAALTHGTAVTALAVAVAAAVIATLVDREPAVRAAHAGFGAVAITALASVATLAAGYAQSTAGFIGAIAAALVLVGGCLVRRDSRDGVALEIVGGSGMLVGALLTLPSLAWFAGTLTAMVPLLLVASLRRDRAVGFAGASGAVALAATWAWLAAAGVTVVEAYTLPAAAVALAAGAWAWHTGRARSWLNLGPALVLALGPTLVLAIARNDDGRAIAVGVAALLVVLIGAWRQLQAPLAIGVITLLALAVDRLGPQAARLPRWALLAGAGALLLWVGTTFERRRDGVQRAARRLGDLG